MAMDLKGIYCTRNFILSGHWEQEEKKKRDFYSELFLLRKGIEEDLVTTNFS